VIGAPPVPTLPPATGHLVAETGDGGDRRRVSAVTPERSAVVAQTTLSVSHRYSLYTPELNLLAETERTASATPAVQYEYVWFDGRPVAQIENASGTIHYYFDDHLGTPVLTTNSSGAVDWRVEREPYGARFALRAGATRYQPLAFPGQEEDVGTDRSYNIYRWYRAGWGRYTQSDPLGLGPDINVYRYANSNPIGIDDPFGLDTAGCDEVGKYQINETPCRAECCAQHDQCYDVNHCSAGSWPKSTPKTPCDTAPGCRKCNDDVKDCFKKCLRKELFGTKDDPKKPNYYCGAQHRFIRIPGDFANINDARKACECDYSKACPLVSRPLTPTVPKSKP
jgi:RHS repeat-associated protein